MPLYLVRHADAGTRQDRPEDGERPLSPRGRVRAQEIAADLAAVGITEIWSSPLLRCRETLEPLGDNLGVEVNTTGALAEGAPLEESIDLVERLAAQPTVAALCSHGDVIPGLLAALARRGAELDRNGGCAKGSIWVLDVESGEVVRGRYAGTVQGSVVLGVDSGPNAPAPARTTH